MTGWTKPRTAEIPGYPLNTALVRVIAPLSWRPYIIDPSNSRTLYFGTFRIWQTRDGAGSWFPISPDLTGGNGATITAIAVASSDPNTVYAGTFDGRVQVTNNALDGVAASWTNRTTGLASRTATSITVDPIDASTAYVTYSGFLNSNVKPNQHVFKTTDAGAKWTDISGDLPDLPVNSLAVDPDLADTLYIGTDAGVMVSTNGGGTWSSLGNGLPKVVVLSVVLHRPSRTLRAATHGRGVWDILIPLASKSSSGDPAIQSLSPSTANAGGAGFALSVTGAKFGAGTKLRWNGLSRSTTLVDSQHLTAKSPAADIANVGIADIECSARPPAEALRTPCHSTSVRLPIRSRPSTPPWTRRAWRRAASRRFMEPTWWANGAATARPRFPSTLGGTTLSMPGPFPVALFYVSPLQIDFQVPFLQIFGSTHNTLTVTQGQLSHTLNITLVPHAPAIFTTNSQGTGQAAALIGGSLAAPIGAFPGSRPAKPGEFGVGVLHRPGQRHQRSRTRRARGIESLVAYSRHANRHFGRRERASTFSGLAPGFVGCIR